VKGFFDAQTVDSLAPFCRHSSRVKPLMEQYYGGKKVPLNRLLRVMQLEPLTIDNRPNFWVLIVELANHETRNLALEILENGEPRVDWETMVCYQPMDWKTYSQERPNTVSMDFRVNVEANDFYSHEFANPKEWESFRLTTRDSGEILYGYAKAGTPEAKEIIENLVANGGRKCSMILRLSIPKGMQSPHAVVIERLLSTRWMYLDPPPD
jgi:hypothetical protein